MQADLDELFRRIAEEPDARARIPLLHNAAMLALGRNQQRALPAAEEAVQLSEQYGDRWSIAMSWLLKGRALSFMARYAEGLEASTHSYDLFHEHGDMLNAAHALSDIGSALTSLGDYPRAFDTLSRSLSLAEEVQADTAIAYTLNRLGYLWHRLGSQSQALLYWQRCVAVAEQIGNENFQATVNNNIANICIEIGEYDRALASFRQALERALARGDKYREAMTRVNMAEVLQMESLFEEAMEHQKISLELFRALGHQHFEGVVLSNMGRLLEKTDRIAEAFQHQQQAMEILQHSSDKQDMVKIQLRLGVLYRRMGEYDRGIAMLQEAREIVAGISADQLQSKISKQLSIAYEEQGNHDAALAEYRIYMKLRNKLLRENKVRAVELVRLRSEVEGSVREKEIQRIRNTELAGALEKVQALSAHYKALNRENSLLVDTVTQKLRSPLVQIASASMQMRRSMVGGNRDEDMGFLSAMEQDARRTSRTVDMLLLAHALEAGKFVPDYEPFDMASLATKVIEDFCNKARHKNIALRLIIGSQCIAAGDVDAVRQILNALVSNAILYSPGGGEVSVGVGVRDGVAVIRIEDGGPGLSRSSVRKLAAAASSTGEKPFPPGSGFSLALAFAAAVRGTLRYERKKKRTALIFEFPTTASAATV